MAPNTVGMHRSLRYTGVAAVVAVWTILLTATAVTGFDLFGEEPLSYLGSQPRSAALFTLGLAVPALLLTAFHQYLRGRFPVSPGFSLAMLGGLVGQVVAAFVPIGGEPAFHRVHTTSALVLGASLPLLMWRFAASQPPGPWRRLSYGLFWAELAACAAGLHLSSLNVAPVAEILPGAVFHTWVVTVTFGEGRVQPPTPRSRVPARAGTGSRFSSPVVEGHTRCHHRRGGPPGPAGMPGGIGTAIAYERRSGSRGWEAPEPRRVGPRRLDHP
ncbi:MAG TPA: hypothetical protein VG455_03400 [Acidimicrobiales bacterium]|nr:hypothetical protein [Acidimicrobiales bacterium]